jgi:hypothetical protein
LLSLLLLAACAVLLAMNLPERGAALGELAREGTASAVGAARNSILGPPRIGLQVGHLESFAHPPELERLRTSTGGHGGGMLEVEVNEAVAQALAVRLRSRGFQVDLLPATVPVSYRADAVVAIHADSSPLDYRRGYKSAVFQPLRNRWDQALKSALDGAYLAVSGLPDDDANVTGDMLEYYAFNGHYRHSLAKGTPAAIVELGYLSHPLDRELLGRPQLVAALLESGIVSFLEDRGRLRGTR